MHIMSAVIYSIDTEKLMFRNCLNIFLHSALFLLVSIIIIWRVKIIV